MKSMNYDDWQAFLDQREAGPGWQWPLNLAVALHLAVFGSAMVLQNMAGSSPGLKLDKAVMVNFISLSATGPLTAAPADPPAPAVAEAPPLVELTAGKQRKIFVRAAEPKAEVKPEKPAAKEAVPPSAAQEVKLEPKAVKKEAAAPALVQPEPKVLEQVKPLAKTAEPVQLKPEPVKKTAVEQLAPKPQPAPAAKIKEAVSLNPVKPKEKVQEAAEEKAREQAEAVALKRQAELAEVKKQEVVKAAKLEAEKKAAAAESKRVAEEKARKEKESAKIAEAKKKEQARIAEAAKVEAEKKAAAAEARKKLAAQERQKALAEARRIEHEADAARQAAVAAREQLVRALRENMAVSAAAAASRGGGSLLGTGRGSGLANATATVSLGGLSNYARQLNEQISSRWKVPELAAGNRKLKTVVALTVNKNGTIEDLQIERKSGDPIFDQSVVKALRSAPLPKFSALVTEKDRLEFALNFTPQGLTL